MKLINQISTTLIVAISSIFSLSLVNHYQANPVREEILLTQTNWEPQVSETGQFNVELPEGKIETNTLTIPIAEKPVEWQVLKLQDESGLYAVAYTDVTDEIIDLGANAVIDSIKNTLVTDLNWSTIEGNGRVISVQGYPGREIIGSKDEQVSVLRLILANQRLYAVMSRADNLGNIGKFFESFAINLWQPYVFEEEGFKVDLPLSPSTQTNTLELAGKVYTWDVIESRNFTAPDDSYAVGYTDVSPEDLNKGSHALLQRVGEDFINSLPLTRIIENGRKISLDEHEGIAFVGINELEQIVTIHFYLVGERLYGITAISDDIINIGKFMNSFEIQEFSSS